MSTNLKQWLTENGLSVREFAERMSIPYVTMSAYVYARRTPSRKVAMRLASATGLPVIAILNLVDTPAPHSPQTTEVSDGVQP